MRLELEGAGLNRVRDAFVTAWLYRSPPSIQVIDEGALPDEFQKAVLRLPYSLVPEALRGFIQHVDIDRAALLDLLRRTGEVPDGVTVNVDAKHVRIQ
jgi:hypothetical protein